MADLCARFLAEYAVKKRERSRIEHESLIRQWILPQLGSQKVADIQHSDIDRLHQKITAHGTSVRANRVVTLLSRLFTLSVRRGWRVGNPASGIERNEEQPRTRYLSPDELRRLIAALQRHSHQQSCNVSEC
jgi:hypothetical protein